MLSQGGLKRKSKASSEIPSSSLADMAFLLLIFFMVTTVFRKEQKRDVVIPEAEATQKLSEPRKNIVHLYVERDGAIFINDARIPTEQVAGVIGPLYQQTDRRLIVVIRADRDVAYRYIDQVQKQLQAANAVRVTFYTNLEQRLIRERR
jgi:biopolymer transport protein ExbD